MYLYVFHCLCFIKKRNVDMLEGQLRVKRDPELDTNGFVRLCGGVWMLQRIMLITRRRFIH